MKIEKLDEQFLNEMAQIGNYSEYIVYVISKEGPIPHVHIVDKQTFGHNYNCCVRLDCAEYFSHGSKQEVLNSKTKKDFINFMNKNNDEFNMSNYEVAVKLWNLSNPSYKISINTIPDYTLL